VTNIRVKLASNGEVLAEGPLGWGITSFEGNLYIRKKHMRTDKFRVNYVPGLCPYKFLYVWMNLHLLPFIWFRVALPRAHPDLEIEEY